MTDPIPEGMTERMVRQVREGLAVLHETFPDIFPAESGKRPDKSEEGEISRYQDLLDIVEINEQAMSERLGAFDEEDRAHFNYYLAADLALNAAELAHAEQLRIANLLAVAANPMTASTTRARAHREALESLDLP